MPKTAAATAPNARRAKMMGLSSNIAGLIFEVDHAVHHEVPGEQHEQAKNCRGHDDWMVENAAEICRRKHTYDADEQERRSRKEDAGEPAFGRQCSHL